MKDMVGVEFGCFKALSHLRFRTARVNITYLVGYKILVVVADLEV